MPWVENRLADLPADHPARKDLESLADRLANVVHRVKVVSGEEAIRLGLEGRIADLEGKRLDPDRLIGLFLDALERLPRGAGDVRLEADRLGDGTGVEVRIEVTPAAGGPGGLAEHHYSVTADGRPMGSSSGSGVLEVHDDPRDYKDVLKTIASALATHHAETFEIRIDLQVR